MSDFKQKLKFLYQRLTRGWDDSDTWSLDTTIAEFTLPRLKRFKELNIGHPPELTSEEWDAILDKTIKAMELIATEWDYKPCTLSVSEEEVIIQEGLDLFGKYFRHLWW